MRGTAGAVDAAAAGKREETRAQVVQGGHCSGRVRAAATASPAWTMNGRAASATTVKATSPCSTQMVRIRSNDQASCVSVLSSALLPSGMGTVRRSPDRRRDLVLAVAEQQRRAAAGRQQADAGRGDLAQEAAAASGSAGTSAAQESWARFGRVEAAQFADALPWSWRPGQRRRRGEDRRCATP